MVKQKRLWISQMMKTMKSANEMGEAKLVR